MATPNVQISFGPRFHPRTAPVTFWFLVACGVVTLALFFAGSYQAPAMDALAFSTAKALSQPWTLCTYPLLNDPLGLLLLGYVMWWAGADTEGWWGSNIHAGYLATVTALSALMLWLGAALPFGDSAAFVFGLGLPVAGVLAIWALRHLRGTIYLLIIPVTGAVLLALEVVIVWVTYRAYLGFFAVLGSVGFAALYFYYGQHFHRFLGRLTGGGSNGGGKPKAPKKPGFREKREQQKREKRFKDIMETSGLRLVEDDEPKGSSGSKDTPPRG